MAKQRLQPLLITNGLIILCLLLLNLFANPQAAQALIPQDEQKTTGLFRTQVNLDNPQDRQRLEEFGVLVLQ